MGSKERFYADIMATHPEVTGSCNLVIVKFPNGETLRFVVDCGLFREKEYDEYNNTLPFTPEHVDFCLVTHNHIDHVGRLPLMVKEGYYKGIYATKTTCKFLPLALYDSHSALHDTAKRKNQKCLYNETDIDNTLKLLKPCEYNEMMEIHPNVKVMFLQNGHLLGAAMIFVQISYPGQADINILFTGDYKKDNIFFDVDSIPEFIRKLPLTIVQESTYGDIDTRDIKPCFKENIIKSIRREETIIVPVFSLGRSQEILYELKCMQEDGVLGKHIPIYLDGKLAIKYTDLYLKDGLEIKPEMRKFLPDNLTFSNSDLRDKLLEDHDAKIILTTSGMGSYGPAQVYIPAYITRKNALIHFTGYTAEGTLGGKLKAAGEYETVEVSGMMLKKLASVEYTSEYSAHAKADEMIDFLNQFDKLKLVLVNHGEYDTKEKFANRVLEEVSTKNVGILGRDFFFRICPFGFVKTLSSKF